MPVLSVVTIKLGPERHRLGACNNGEETVTRRRLFARSSCGNTEAEEPRRPDAVATARRDCSEGDLRVALGLYGGGVGPTTRPRESHRPHREGWLATRTIGLG